MAERKARRPRERKFTIDEAIQEAFTYEQKTGGTRDLQKTLLAVALLLDAQSECGNEPLEGWIAFGLGEVIRNCARDLRDYYQSKNPDFRIENGGELVPVDGQKRTI